MADVKPMGILSAYEPSLRDRIAFGIGGLLGGDNYRQGNTARKIGGLLDFIPGIGDVIGFEDAKRDFDAGNYGQAALGAGTSTVGLVPGGGDVAAGLMKAIFGGIGAKTADMGRLNQAAKMAMEGADRDAIWKDTGWFKGVDGNWRFEIDDSAAQFTPKTTDDLLSGPGAASGVAQATAPGILMHKPLYEAYPDIRKTRVTASYKDGGNIGGQFDDGPVAYGADPQITASSDMINGGGDRGLRGVLLHELQHNVQMNEGFARGGSPETAINQLDEYIGQANDRLRALAREMDKVSKSSPEYAALRAEYDALMDEKLTRVREFDSKDAYKRLAGEVEARNVARRMNMSADERRARPPWSTQDVPDELQIVRRR